MLDTLNTVWENLTSYLLAGGSIVAFMGFFLLVVTAPRGNSNDITLSAWLFALGVLMCCPTIWRHFKGSI